MVRVLSTVSCSSFGRTWGGRDQRTRKSRCIDKRRVCSPCNSDDSRWCSRWRRRRRRASTVRLLYHNLIPSHVGHESRRFTFRFSNQCPDCIRKIKTKTKRRKTNWSWDTKRFNATFCSQSTETERRIRANDPNFNARFNYAVSIVFLLHLHCDLLQDSFDVFQDLGLRVMLSGNTSFSLSFCQFLCQTV